MSEWLASFHLLRPWWLLLALAWVPGLIWRMRAQQRGAALERLVDADLLPHLLEHGGKMRRGSWWLAFLAGALTTLALAGPTWQRLPQPLYADGAAQVVAVSLSRRMLARDVKPDRMQRVRYKVHDLLHANVGGRNALVAYAGAAFTVAPLTTDARALDNLLNALDPGVMPVPGDAPAKAIKRGVALLEHGGSLVLVTDAVDAAAIAAARHAHQQGIRVSVLGVGTDQGVPVPLPGGGLLADADGDTVMARRDAESLRALADAGGGVYVPMRADGSDIKALATQLRPGHDAPAQRSARGERWRDMGPWLLLPLLLLAALGFRRGWLLLLALVCLPSVPRPVYAADTVPALATTSAASDVWQARWSALWRNADQRAARALASGHAKRAQQLAQSSGLRGTAAYRAGDYAAAVQSFADAPGADAAYNRGNALAKQGRYRQAIKAYDQALKLDPQHTDAQANRNAVRDWLRKHKPPPQPDKPGSRASPSGTQQGEKSSSSKAHKPSDDKGAAKASSSPSSGSQASNSSSATSSGSRPRPAPATSSGKRAQPASAGSSGKPKAPPPDPDAVRRQQAEARRASRALHQRMRQHDDKRQGSPRSFELGQAPAHAGSAAPLPSAMQRALERVHDDPGGLLRRKFLLEYRQRLQGRDGEGP